MAGIGTGAASGVQLGLLGSAVHSVRREEGERGGENEHDSVRIRMGVCARWARFVGATRGDPNVEAGEALTKRGHSNRICVILADFDRPSSKFYIGTRNLAKIKVVEDEKIYNFAFGRKLN